MAEQESGLGRLGQALLHKGLLTPQEALRYAQEARGAGERFAAWLLQSGRFSSDELADFIAKSFALPRFDLAQFNPAKLPQGLPDMRTLAGRPRILPVRLVGDHLLVAIADPEDLPALSALQLLCGYVVDPVVVEADRLEQGIDAYYRGAMLQEARRKPVEDEWGDAVSDDGVVQLLQELVQDALAQECSDIHFEPFEDYGRIRFRRDGELHEKRVVTPSFHTRLVSRLKIMGRLDIAEKRLPQDGHLKMSFATREGVDFRLSTLPTLHGEKAVLRILDNFISLRRSLEELGYEKPQIEWLTAAINRPYGMILVTGPTGSGKTVSLYACLRQRNQPGVNICTVEDPVEIQVPGLSQVNINEKAGLDFATVLRAFLRQDPDIIMVGEVRDGETADIAVKAAQTGHLVFSTLHTNDVSTTLERMLRMGVAGYNIASSVLLITAQRLVRRLCSHCKRPQPREEKVLREAGFSAEQLAGDWVEYGPHGCSYCQGSGYHGRVGVYEVVPMSEALRSLVIDAAPAASIAAQTGAEGHLNLRQAGLLKVKAGITSLTEILANTNA
jgi:type IV pilus assembly protein PilB